MKNTLLIISAIAFSSWVSGQVGINTQAPKATLDVTASPTDATKSDGFIAPRLTGNELKAKDALYLAAQTGAIVYVTQAASPITTKTAKVTGTGYYYFDGSVWQNFIGPNIYNSDGTLLTNRFVNMANNVLTFYNGSNSIGINNNGNQSIIVNNGSMRGASRVSGGNASFFDMFVDNGSVAQLVTSGTTTGLVVGTNTATPVSFVANGGVRATILSTGEIGVGTANPNSTLQVNGSFSANLRTLASGTVANNDYTVMVTGNISLPVANATNIGRIYNLINGNTNSNILSGTFMTNGATISNYTLNNSDSGRGIVVQSTGAAWLITSKY
ncbi:hypothetical protein [Chryseobacterium sp. SIMBA_029]|uniref:hypothetical protein n=1 Tax=Chryseobacterium sp. SIMBA_029 TaxID=3085772 RepID=UPI00397B3B84